MRKINWKRWYPNLTRLTTKENPVTFLNYGYLDPNIKKIELQPDDEADRVCIQLYHHITAAIDMADKAVLDVSCGHGGGASYVMRYLQPEYVVGVDFNAKAIDFCQSHYSLEGLSFAQSDAESLQFDDNSFDVVINVEASHCYANIGNFLGEVYRVLRPGGYFLCTDFRELEQIDILEEQLAQCELEMIKEEDITANVFRAMSESSEVRRQLVDRAIPERLRLIFENFSGIKGSDVYISFEAGTLRYLNYALRKPEN